LGRLTARWPHPFGIFLLVAMAIGAIALRTAQFNYLFAFFVVEAVLRAIPVSTIRAGWVVRIFRWGNHTVFYTMWFVTMMAFMKSPVQAVGIIVMALGAAHREYKLFVLRRKVPVEQWPRLLWI